MFSRVLGPYLVVAAATLVGRPGYTKTILHAFDGNSAWPWVTGAFVLPMGLIVVALHPYWRGLAAATVSTLGWLTVLKGVALMTFPRTYLSMGQDAFTATPWWETTVVIMALFGIYLTVVGWAPNHQPAQSASAADPLRAMPRWV
ncbi:hypothetical protein FZI85_04155 [Mycobacterium sp. CBMA293]|nr:hypothetical protein [Mycolicibacterium sp. CBMA 360]MUL58506.1 hypothetical protein [Mycolicibacterium sp. CBMA 335]MUL73964.1 hypothetical protein [Mycolicibacterium sp. CBMA 311]MUL93389.1 hypothetical protein [Mycolicibacterium sp. CBMA 230]MUM04604.1 hypothetical protein [Mycolicibacterium sp. CBMA 213]MUM10232.1 hypothetical protein [Mycolicibacterium sp. CBMA 293]MUM33029.1 hypothetical protein [Mycolicibacterium sp. CBMA 361]